ncbi:MAG: hypothetical protein H0W12_12015 [Chitinophagaceae bacterium]|nr:hypothetical protein [Chitinophagaceae bacterium]
MKKYSMMPVVVTAIVTVIMGLIYVTVQQTYRTSANDPQVQMARDMSTKLLQSKSVDAYFTDTVDVAQSLAPFYVLYDASGKPIRSTGYLDGQMYSVPMGVFETVKKSGEQQVTCQPRKSIRMAMVIERTNTGPVAYVAAGRSLKMAEERISILTTTVFIAWLICSAIILLCYAIRFFKYRN